jgi:hypothetical protein
MEGYRETGFRDRKWWNTFSGEERLELYRFYGYVLLASHTSCFLEVDQQNNCIFSVTPTPLKNISNLRMPMD